MSDINISLDDNSKYSLPEGSTFFDLVQIVPKELSYNVVLAKINNKVFDLSDKLFNSCQVSLLDINSKDGLDALNHSCEHILAAAVCNLIDKTKVVMGPKIHNNNFYYDFDIGRSFTNSDLLNIEDEMKKLISKKLFFEKLLISKKQALMLFHETNQVYKKRILSWINDDVVSIYKSGNFIDLCRGPHLPHTGFIKSFKLLFHSGSYWRNNSNNSMLQRITGIAFSTRKSCKEHLIKLKKIKKNDHRKLGSKLSFFMLSKKFDIHNYASNQNFVLVNIKINDQIQSMRICFEPIFKYNLFEKIEKIISIKIKLNKINFVQLATDNNIFGIELKFFSNIINKIQRDALSLLVNEFNKLYINIKLKINIEKHYVEEVGTGLVTWLPNGACVKFIIEDIIKNLHYKNNYQFISSPHIAKSDLWKVSGHLDFYKDVMFTSMLAGNYEYLLKPMNCPFHVLVFKNQLTSYRDLPVRYAELGTVYRYEMPGVMHGLMRVRGFTQDDAHIFCSWKQIQFEIDNIIYLSLELLKIFGFSKFDVNLSTRPQEFIGTESEWKLAEDALLRAIKNRKLPFVISSGNGAFYGPKIDIILRDCLNRPWQCSTIQLDFNTPRRFNLKFKNNKGIFETPVMLHRVLLGSIERFIGILIEEYEGSFPFWLAPEQVRIITITDQHYGFASKLKFSLQNAGIRVKSALDNKKLSAKLRIAQLEKIPVMLLIGNYEASQNGATIRLRSGKNIGFMKVDNLITYLTKKSKIPLLI